MIESISIMGVTVGKDAAAKMQPVQDAAIVEVDNICRNQALPKIALDYSTTTTIGTDSCERFEQFANRAGQNDKNFLFYIHTTRFGCTQMHKHADMVVTLAQAYLSRGVQAF